MGLHASNTASGKGEEAIIQAWLNSRFRIIHSDGTSILIIYPGRRRRGPGPDLRDAVVNINGQRLTGDVEVHIKASDWYAHCHHLDPVYRNTILHIVMKNDLLSPVLTLEGNKVTPLTLVNSMPPTPPGLEQSSMPCHGRDVSKALTLSGIRRLELKTKRFTEQLNSRPPEEVMFQGIAVALGYRENQSQMRALTNTLTLLKLNSHDTDARPHHRLLFLEASLLWHSGFLTAQLAETIPQANSLWSMTPKQTDKPPMERGLWNLNGTRPNNSPVRRLIALAHLIHSHNVGDFHTRLLEPLDAELPVARLNRLLEEKLVIPPTGYWANHWDFARPLPRPYALIGKERASAIITNVILPFATSLGRIVGNQHLIRNALQVYLYQPVQGQNEITRYMSNLLLFQPTNACTEQGMIHIYLNWCRAKLCEECPASSNQRVQLN